MIGARSVSTQVEGSLTFTEEDSVTKADGSVFGVTPDATSDSIVEPAVDAFVGSVIVGDTIGSHITVVTLPISGKEDGCDGNLEFETPSIVDIVVSCSDSLVESKPVVGVISIAGRLLSDPGRVLDMSSEADGPPVFEEVISSPGVVSGALIGSDSDSTKETGGKDGVDVGESIFVPEIPTELVVLSKLVTVCVTGSKIITCVLTAVVVTVFDRPGNSMLRSAT